MIALLGCALALALPVGCGSGGATRTGSTASTVAAPTPTPTSPPVPSPAAQARAARANRLERLREERSFAPNPYPEPPAGRPHPHGRIDRLVVREIERGRGPALRGDDSVYVNYVKTYWKSGKKFLVSWGPGRFENLVMEGQSPGLRRGMLGMRPGGRRVILMPAAISDVHEPNGGAGFVDARVDVVLRKILP